MNVTQTKVLVVDDEAGMRNMLCMVLEKDGYQVTEAAEGQMALDLLKREPFDVVLCDIRMPGMDGLSFLAQLSDSNITTTLIMMSAYGNVDTALECMKRGAYDYISKPFKPDEVVLTLRKALERQRLLRENASLRKKLTGANRYGIVSHSKAMVPVFDLVERVADSDSAVLIMGETGTGKELVARALHFGSKRSAGPFVAVNCSAISTNLLESELFGHARGAFTGAGQERHGLFAAAEGGTLFLDEIGELPLDLQPKLLRVLQESEIRRVGENRLRKINVRILAATGRNLRGEVDAGRFRVDLYYRLAVVEICVPPLRERPEDVVLLAEHFIREIAERNGQPVPRLGAAVLEWLQTQQWPGNVRELENFLKKAMVFCRGDEIELEEILVESRQQAREIGDEYSLKLASARLEKEYIRKALAATRGNRTQAAKLLEISLRGLLYKIKTHRIE